MSESIEERLQRSLTQAEDKRLERERLAYERRQAEQNAADKEAADQRDFANRFDSFDGVLQKIKKSFEERSDLPFRMVVSGRPNPAPNLREMNVTFSQKAGPKSHSFSMHVNPKGIFQIHSLYADLFSIGIMKLNKDEFQELVFTRFDLFAQCE